MAETQESGDSELDAIAEDIIEMSDDYETFFRDPSGIILPNDVWYPRLTFWSIVATKIRSALPSLAEK